MLGKKEKCSDLRKSWILINIQLFTNGDSLISGYKDVKHKLNTSKSVINYL